MNITRNNYEAYFLDYLENNLSPELLSELRAFLAVNPDLAAELQEMSDMPILFADAAPEALTSDFKNGLLRDENMQRAQYLIVAELEGDATVSELAELQKLSKQHSFVAQEKELFAKTKLVADSSIRFFHKQALLQKEAVVISFRRVISIAAAAAIAALIGISIFSEDQTALTAYNPNKQLPLIEKNGGADSLKSNERSVVPPFNTSAPAERKNSNDLTEEQELAQQPTIKEVEKNDSTEQINPLAPHSAEEIAQLPLNVPDIAPDMKQVVLPNATTPSGAATKAPEYLTVWQFAENKAKEKIWGNTNYPDQNFANAFAQREIQKRFGKTPTKVELVRENKAKEKSFRLKIGSFEISRKH